MSKRTDKIIRAMKFKGHPSESKQGTAMSKARKGQYSRSVIASTVRETANGPRVFHYHATKGWRTRAA